MSYRMFRRDIVTQLDLLSDQTREIKDKLESGEVCQNELACYLDELNDAILSLIPDILEKE